MLTAFACQIMFPNYVFCSITVKEQLASCAVIPSQMCVQTPLVSSTQLFEPFLSLSHAK